MHVLIVPALLSSRSILVGTEAQQCGIFPEAQWSGIIPEAQQCEIIPEAQRSGIIPEAQRSGIIPEAQRSGTGPSTNKVRKEFLPYSLMDTNLTNRSQLPR